MNKPERKVIRYESWLDAYARSQQDLVNLISRNWDALAPPELEEWLWHEHLNARVLAGAQLNPHRSAAA